MSSRVVLVISIGAVLLLCLYFYSNMKVDRQMDPSDTSVSFDLEKISNLHVQVEQGSSSIPSINTSPNFDEGASENLTHISEELELRYDLLSDNDAYPTLESRLREIKKRRPNSKYSVEDILSSMENPGAWQTINQAGPRLLEKLNQDELNDDRQFVEFDPIKIETLMQGDSLDVPVDSIGRVFNMRVDSVRNFGDGNIMWKGPITNVEGGGTVTITQSEKISVAAVVLAQEDFTLQSHGPDGWIIESGKLFKANPNGSDIVPTGH